VETWLRLAGLKYENVDHKMKHRSKKGQLPFVELNGEEIADSTLVIKELSQKFGKDIDAALSQDQRNISHAMISMIENKLVWVITWWKTKTPENVIKGYKVNLQHALGTWVPNGVLNFFFKYSYSRRGLKKVKAQGIGVHKPEEILEFGQNDLKVLSDVLGDKLYFFGNEPTTLDVVAFANLAQLYFIDKEVECQLRDYLVDNFENLVEHTNRIKERCFPDWDDMCKNLDLNSHLPKPPPAEEKPKEDGDKKATENKTTEKEASKEPEEKSDAKKEGEKEPEDK
jgi:glutathione S-transferase